MELRHLRYFVTVATERSFSRASEKLHIAQPPLSRQIQQLEEELGSQLLHRGRPITLTESGRYLFEQALQILQRTDEMGAMTRRIGAGKKRQFGIGFVASTLYSTLPELIRSFRTRAPDVEIVLSELTTLEQVAALKQGRIDIGFGRLLFNDDAVSRHVLHEEKLSVAAAPCEQRDQERGDCREEDSRGCIEHHHTGDRWHHHARIAADPRGQQHEREAHANQQAEACLWASGARGRQRRGERCHAAADESVLEEEAHRWQRAERRSMGARRQQRQVEADVQRRRRHPPDTSCSPRRG